MISGSVALAAGSFIVYSGADWVTDPDVTGGYKIRLNDGVEPRHLYQYDAGDDEYAWQTPARYPNSDPITGWMHNESYNPSGTDEHTDRCGNVILGGDQQPELVQQAQLTSYESLPLTTGLAGAELVIRTANWQYERRKVQEAVDANTIRIRLLDRDIGNYNWGFFFQGIKHLIDQAGEWAVHCDGTGNWLHYLPAASGTPSGVRVSFYARGIVINSSCTSITIAGVDFEHQYEGGITIGNNSDDVDIQYCGFRSLFRGVDDKRDAANGGTSANHTVSHNTFDDVYDTGLLLFGNNSSIEDNTLQRIGLRPGQATTGFFNSHGMRLGGQGIAGRLNELREIGYAGMNINGNGTIERNHLFECLVELNDGGGIQFDFADGLTILENVVNGAGVGGTNLLSTATISWSGTPSNTFPHSFYRQVCYGIYFGDKDIQNTRVERNVVTRCTKGIHVDHSLCSEKAMILDNTLFGNGVQLSMTDYSNWTEECGGNGDPDNNQGEGIPPPAGNYLPGYPNDVYEGNIMYSLSSDQLCVEQAHVWPGSFATQVDFGTFKNNFYFNPFTQASIVQIFKFSDEADLPDDQLVPWTLSGWMAAGHEQGGMASPLRLLDFEVTQEVEELTSFGNLFQAAGEVTAWGVATTNDPVWNPGGYLEANDLDYIFKGGAVLQVDDAPSGSSETEEGYYRFTFDMRSTDTQAIGFWPLFRGGNYERFKLIGLGSDWDTYQLLMYADHQGNDDDLFNSFTNLRRILDAQTTSNIDLDYISAHRVAINEDYDEDVIALEHILRYYAAIDGIKGDPNNVAATSGTFNVPDFGECWSDVHGNFYAPDQEIALLPWESIVLFRFDPPAEQGNASTETHITGQTTWTEHRNQLGRVVVDDGATLIIDGAHVGFEESTSQFANNITVEPGGTLILKNGANLRNWMGCAGAAMWDGVKVLGNGTTVGAGLVVTESGARISNALTALRTADGEPGTIFGGDDMSGGIVQATDAAFVNNQYDVVTRPHADIDPVGWGPSFFTRCAFVRNAALVEPTLPPGSRISLMQSAGTEFTGCAFENTSGLAPTDPGEWGFGIHSINTRIRVVRDEESERRGSFKGLSAGILHSAYDLTSLAVVDQCDFEGNARGALVYGTNNCILTRCNFQVADVEVEELSVEGAYGAYFFGCSGFEVEENTFVGLGDTKPKVGAVLRNTGFVDNMYYNNTFNHFSDAVGISAGTVIMGENAVVDGVGLRIACNDYSAIDRNDYDVAFTNGNVLVADQQGAAGPDTEDPAGNTFALVDPSDCDGNPEQHFYKEVGVNAFEYWHHEPQAQVELVPHCHDASIVIESTEWPYDKPVSCPVDLSQLVPIGDDEVEAGEAYEEQDVLVEVYDDWSDGGSTEGLINYILDTDNDSYAVRNKLMLVAPSVSADAWRTVLYDRDPPLNPWHLAQALLANSPLESSVLDMVENLPIDPFYKELVLEGQAAA